MTACMPGRNRGAPWTLLTLCSTELYTSSLTIWVAFQRGRQPAALLTWSLPQRCPNPGQSHRARLEFWHSGNILISLNHWIPRAGKDLQDHRVQPRSSPSMSFCQEGPRTGHSTRGASAVPTLRFEHLPVSQNFYVLKKNLIITGNLQRSEQFIFVECDWRLMDTIRNNLVKIYQTHEKQNLLLSEANTIKEQVPWMNSNETQLINQMPVNISHLRDLLI